MLGKIKPATHTDSDRGLSKGQEKPKLALVPNEEPLAQEGLSSDQQLAQIEQKRTVDQKLLIRFFQLLGNATYKIALISRKRCADIYQAAVLLQKKFGKNHKGGIIDKRIE